MQICIKKRTGAWSKLFRLAWMLNRLFLFYCQLVLHWFQSFGAYNKGFVLWSNLLVQWFGKSMYVKCGMLFVYLPQEFSSEPSLQSFSPLQNKPRSIQAPSPQARKPSWQSGSSVINKGFTLRSLFLLLQFLTASFQSQVCFSISKYKPAGHLMAWRPYCYKR